MSFVDTWDSGQPGANWDTGLQWDVNVGPSVGDVSAWVNLITSEHRSQPNFVLMVSSTLQPLADIIAVLSSMPGLYDLDTAVGSQLDADGVWVGVGRSIAVPLSGVFFSWDTVGLGWSQGNWTPGINVNELILLPDTQYRTLLYARIAANHWDGSVPQAYQIWNMIFSGTGFGILIQDLQGMNMTLALTGPVPDAVTRALFTGGYLNLKPAGVRINRYYTPAQDNVPYFGWGVANDNIAGWDLGYWGVSSPGM